MEQDKEILHNLIKGGVVGATLGALLTSNKRGESYLGAIAGAVLFATFKASQQAQYANVVTYIEEDGSIFELQPGGSKTFVRKIDKSNIKVATHFKLK